MKKSIILILIIAFTVFAQEKKINSDALLRLRNLQYEHAKRVVRMQDLKNEFDRLNTEQIALAGEIDKWIREQAKEQNVDLAKFRFDLDKMEFIEIKKNEKENSN